MRFAGNEKVRFEWKVVFDPHDMVPFSSFQMVPPNGLNSIPI